MDYMTNALPVFKNECLDILRIDRQDARFLIFVFRGKLTDRACEEACEIWNDTVQSDPSVVYTHIWDCEKMTGFEQKAKNRWMDAMNYHSNRTNSIWLISDNILIRGAARLMSKFSRHELKVFRKKDEVQIGV